MTALFHAIIPIYQATALVEKIHYGIVTKAARTVASSNKNSSNFLMLVLKS